MNSKRLEAYNPLDYKAIIVDEAHHATSSTYQRVLQHFGVFNDYSSVLLWGCSATLRRHDGIALKPTFETIAYERPITEMIKENWLCAVKLLRMKTRVDLSSIPVTKNDYNLKDLARIVNTPERNNLIVNTYLDWIGTRKSTLIFAADVKHIDDLVKAFQSKGIDARGLDGSYDMGIRDTLISEFRQFKFPVLINCGILTEGTDIPSIDCVILARPTVSKVLLQQMIGRGMRLYEGKEDCLVLDFVDNIRGQDLVMVPTLLGLDPNSFKERNPLTSTKQNILKNENSPIIDNRLSVTGELLPFTDPFGADSVQRDHEHIKRQTMLPWTRVGTQKWVLTIKNSSYLSLKEENGIYVASIHKRYKFPSYHWKSKLILKNDEFKSALQALETFLRKEIGFYQKEMMKYGSRWRNKPATVGQISQLEKFNINRTNLTRGQAFDMIQRFICNQFLLDGAKGVAKNLQALSKNSERLKKKYGIESSQTS